MLKQLYLFICCLSIAAAGNCQNSILQDPVSGTIFNTEKYAAFRGSAFLYDTWMTGSATTINGTYKNLQLKLDIYSNTLLFSNETGERIFKEVVKEFVFMPVPTDTASFQYFKKGLSADGLLPEQYVEILAEGKASLYKSVIKLLTDVNEINTGLVKTFSVATRFYVKKNDALQLLKISKNQLPDFFIDRQAEMQQFIHDRSLALKKPTDLVTAIKYYNKL